MKPLSFAIAFLSSFFPLVAWAAPEPSAAMKTSVAFIANYSDEGQFLGWGSGFFVDEGIVVTNKHVILDGDWYRVYATGSDDRVNMDCYKKITRSDVKINLNDDVAYMRAYLPCEHGTMRFALDPEKGDAVSIIGYPFRTDLETSLGLSITTGFVTGNTYEGWLGTDAYLDHGNSGGPVVNDTDVVGVAVAKGVDENGGYVTGYFIPSSVILNGLLYANDSDFGYTPQNSFASRSSSSRSSSSVSSVRSSFPSSSSSAKSSIRSSRSSSRSSSSSYAQVFPDVRVTRPGYEAIMALYEEGIVSGYPDGTFRPNGGINRAEFIKILVGGFRDQEILGETDCFTDVHEEWFAPYVCAAKRLGWIDGYPDGSFRPAQSVNRAEAVKIVTGAFGAPTPRLTSLPDDVPPGSWFYPFVAKGVLIGIADQSEPFRPGENLTREEAAVWIYEAK